jgi:ABC-type multidrug transport system permease subunit
MQSLVQDINRGLNPFQPGQRLSVPAPRFNPLVDLQVVEMYPYIEYIKYLLSGSIAMSIFIVAMIGGGITFIDDKSRGLHEDYLVTPIKKSELILGRILSGAFKGLMAGTTITLIRGLIADIDRPWDPFTYAVHALKALLLKNAGFQAVYSDIFILIGFSVLLVGLSVAFFKRQI